MDRLYINSPQYNVVWSVYVRIYKQNLHLPVLTCTEGGWIGSEIGKTMERYDPEENKWEVIGSMAVPRYYFGCCELQGACFHFSFFVVLNELFESSVPN